MISPAMRPSTSIVPLVCASGAWLVLGCAVKKPPEQHFYDAHIQPILNNNCVGNTSPCHRIDPATGVALGNLDLSSFDSVQKRRDVLRTYGSYPHPLLLLKALPESAVFIPYEGQLYPSEIRHAGGKPIAPNTDAYAELKRWLDNGANRDGIAPVPTHLTGSGACNTALPPPAKRLPVDTTSPAYQLFVASGGVHDQLQKSCVFASCHSSPQADLYLTCGSDDDQKQFNFAQAAGFVAPAGTAVEQSEILLRPLALAGGGVSHTGGTFFPSRDDDQWKVWRDWATAVQDQPLAPLVKTAGEQFFGDNVMPKLLQRGCALEGCHSPDGFNDLRLRSGAQGFFAPLALRRNYETVRNEFMALDTVDVRQSRAVKKTIIPESGGITHRGGAVLEDSMPIEQACPSPFDPAAAGNRAFCVFQEWHRIERQDAGAAVSAMAAGSTLPVAFVSRPPNPDALVAFDTYRGGADLRLATATLDGAGGVTSLAVSGGSALQTCTGLAGQDVDVRGPEWSADGSKLVFAARPGAGSGLDLWLLDITAMACTQLTSDAGRLVNGVRVHNFDPVFAPDGSLVFASTRAGTLTLKKFLPNSDLFRVGPGLDFSNPEQMTFLLNSELGPAFMQDGRVSFTAEKATPDFYQLSGRRMNWDLTDYHPLLAQRATSTDTFTPDVHPSVGYQQATEIREGLDRNFLVILSDAGALGAGGALATFNRSIGPFEADRTEVTFLKSLNLVDAAATGRDGTAGVYRSPYSLPNGEILASYASNVTHPAADTPRYDLVAVDARTGQRRTLASDPALSYVEAAVGYKRAEQLLFSNLPQLVFGGHVDLSSDAPAIMHFPDLPLLGTLLNANLRRGRDVAALDATAALKVYIEQPPPSASPGGLVGPEMVYSSRMAVGVASLESDHSLKVMVPARKPLILELVDITGKALFTMREEHQVTAGEYVTPGAPRKLFNGICAGCHGSVSGAELDVAVTADALTGASVSASRDQGAKPLQ
jgi:WD40-like Beta Propeller Repeat